MPNPVATSSLQLSMYSFVGKLMGIAIRGKHFLNLDLPSILWKQLVSSEITRSDVEAIDALAFTTIDQIKDAENQGMTPEMFNEIIELNFTTTSAAGEVVELLPGGKDKKVT